MCSATSRKKYIFQARISERKFRQVLRLFAADISPLIMVEGCALNYRTVHRLCILWHERVVALALKELRPFAGKIEIDESYFGPRRVRGRLRSTMPKWRTSQATLKIELIDGQVYATRAEAKSEIFHYIEAFYNRARLHGALGFYSPVDFEHNMN